MNELLRSEKARSEIEELHSKRGTRKHLILLFVVAFALSFIANISLVSATTPNDPSPTAKAFGELDAIITMPQEYVNNTKIYRHFDPLKNKFAVNDPIRFVFTYNKLDPPSWVPETFESRFNIDWRISIISNGETIGVWLFDDDVLYGDEENYKGIYHNLILNKGGGLNDLPPLIISYPFDNSQYPPSPSGKPPNRYSFTIDYNYGIGNNGNNIGGYGNDTYAEKIINATDKYGGVTFRFEQLVNGRPRYTKDIFVPMTNCMQLYGEGKHKIVSMRGKSANLSAPDIINIAENTRTEGFEAIDPFKTYNASFSHFANLKEHDDMEWDIYSKENMDFFTTNSEIAAIDDSSCEDARQYVFYHARTDKFPPGYAIIGNTIVFIHNKKISTPRTAIHEIGHAFCSLSDEYILPYKKTGILNYRAQCTLTPWKDYKYQGNLYGKGFAGCTYENQPGNNKIEPARYYRPSINSIMNIKRPLISKFNVISCGYCMRAIQETNSIKDYWQLCNYTLDTIKPETQCFIYPECSKDGFHGCMQCSTSQCIIQSINTGIFAGNRCLKSKYNSLGNWIGYDVGTCDSNGLCTGIKFYECIIDENCPAGKICDNLTRKCI